MDLNLAFLLVQFESQKGNYLLMPQEVVLCDHSVRQPTPHISADHQPTSQLPIYFLSSVHLMILRGDLLTHLTFWLLTLVVAMSMQMYLYTSVPMIGKIKSRIRETKHLLTDADSSTDTTVGWTKNTQKPNFFEKRKKSSKTQKLKNV